MEKTVFQIIQALFACYALPFLVAQLGWPKHYVVIIDRWGTPNDLPFFRRCWWWAKIFALWVGLFVLTYHAAYGLVGWMPEFWGGYGEDGEWQSARPWVQAAIGVAGVVGLFYAGAHAERAARQPLEASLTSAVLGELERVFHAETAGDLRARILEKLESTIERSNDRELSGHAPLRTQVNGLVAWAKSLNAQRKNEIR